MWNREKGKWKMHRRPFLMFNKAYKYVSSRSIVWCKKILYLKKFWYFVYFWNLKFHFPEMVKKGPWQYMWEVEKKVRIKKSEIEVKFNSKHFSKDRTSAKTSRFCLQRPYVCFDRPPPLYIFIFLWHWNTLWKTESFSLCP
jgi:hypothetical protein